MDYELKTSIFSFPCILALFFSLFKYQYFQLLVSGSQAITLGVGEAGNINIDAPNLSLVNGGVISASTQGKGNGGSIIINTSDRISIDGEDQSGFRSSILNRVEADAVGNAGDINLITNNLSLTNRGRISATVQSSQAQGNAGDINITANSINLIDNSSDSF